jgi:dCMP deaminase
MISEKWDKRFIDLAKFVASWSKDSTQVGAVIVDNNHRIVSVGYNGFPKGIEDKADYLSNRKEKYARVVHSEANAILFSNVNLTGMTLYCTHFPCSSCAALIIQSGVARVVVHKSTNDGFRERWKKSNSVAIDMFDEVGIIVSYS